MESIDLKVLKPCLNLVYPFPPCDVRSQLILCISSCHVIITGAATGFDPLRAEANSERTYGLETISLDFPMLLNETETNS